MRNNNEEMPSSLKFILNISEQYCFTVPKSSIPASTFLARRLSLRSRKSTGSFLSYKPAKLEILKLRTAHHAQQLKTALPLTLIFQIKGSLWSKGKFKVVYKLYFIL